LSSLDGVPGIDYQDQSVSFEANSFMEFYDGVEALIKVASSGWSNVMLQSVLSRGDATEMMGAGLDALVKRWLDTESGKYVRPKPPAPADRKYHGYN
jgi:hypothetical protein